MSTTPSPSAPASLPAPVPTVPEASLPVREHRYDIDVIRLLCSVGVIVSHAGATFLDAAGRKASGGAPAYWTGLFADSLGRFAVPTFFAIAGWAALVGAPPKDGARLRQRMVRLLVPLAVWTALYLLWGRWRGTNDGPIGDLALDSLFASVRPAYHIWYLYAYIPLIMALALIPMMRAGKRPWGVAAVLLAVAAAPTLAGDLSRVTDWDVPRFGWSFGAYQVIYAVLGALLIAAPAGAFGRRRLPWLLLAAGSLVAVIAYQHRIHYVIPNASLAIALLTGGFVLSLHRVRLPDRFRPVVSRLVDATFGVYLVHVMFEDVVAGRLVRADVGWPATVALFLVVSAAITVLSFAAVLLWRRIGLARLLG
ncbi:acyltransferase [Streptomyces sp. PTY087I2]|uniref:acyltransferase n=1 Tax=Streptomyces sp. PTY087I2 TaxID=1819298 RepID=UPI00080B7A1B|nr:acyltransferase [Streptomyces sp. PTY087I2]OCC09478.1 glucans biosynthesis protein [Streptomyces sp. PTY087I2]